MKTTKQRVAKGRGNQGDWFNNRPTYGEMDHHKDHNAEIERKKAAKKARKQKR